MTTTTDIVIAGAGLAGSVAAHELARQGIRVALIDSRAEYPACFKAEKIEADQADLFREFGLMDALQPHVGRVREVLDARGTRVLQVLRLEQYGIAYHDMVNAIRRALPPAVDVRLMRVEGVSLGPDRQQVTLADGAVLEARLFVMACGTGASLSGRLGLKREMIRREHSIAFGFDVAASGAGRFPFDSISYYPDGWQTGIGYLTLFPIGTRMRANLFAYRSLTDDWSRAIVHEPKPALLRLLPRLRSLIGDFEVTSKVESARIDLYRIENQPRAGMIPIGDSYQSVCPTTGTGLSKVLTDVHVLARDCAPAWLSTPGMDVDKTGLWYRHPRKNEVDERSLQKAEYRRRVSIDGSLRWRLHRAKVHLQMSWAGWPESGRATRLTRRSERT